MLAESWTSAQAAAASAAATATGASAPAFNPAAADFNVSQAAGWAAQPQPHTATQVAADMRTARPAPACMHAQELAQRLSRSSAMGRVHELSAQTGRLKKELEQKGLPADAREVATGVAAVAACGERASCVHAGRVR